MKHTTKKNIEKPVKVAKTKKLKIELTPEQLDVERKRVRKITDESLKKIGITLTQYREKRNYTQQQLADKCGVKLKEIINFEDSCKGVHFDLLIIVCAALKLSVIDFMEYAEKLKV